MKEIEVGMVMLFSVIGVVFIRCIYDEVKGAVHCHRSYLDCEHTGFKQLRSGYLITIGSYVTITAVLAFLIGSLIGKG